jgi:peptide/nickel transport system permease protein
VNGIGAALIGAIRASDLPMVQTIVFLFAVLVVLCNLIADVLYAALDPRLRHG